MEALKIIEVIKHFWIKIRKTSTNLKPHSREVKLLGRA